MSLNKDLTIVFVSFYSKNLIEKPINQIDKNIQIIVVENSQDEDLKSYLEKKYSNVKVIVPKKNTGNGGGANLGLLNAKTKFVLYLDIDIELSTQTIKTLYEYANKLDDFSILAPKIDGVQYKEKFYLKKNILENVDSMNFITGCALFFNMEVMKKIGFFDENIFLYYEENDLYLRSLNKNYNIFLINEAKIKHLGNQSTDLIKKEEIEINRNWHLMWSTFYFHKKYSGFFYAVIKISSKFFSALTKVLFYSILLNNNKKKIYFQRLSGLFNSITGKKSWYRPNVS